MAYEVNNIKYGIAPIGWRNDDIPEIGKENTYKQILSEAKIAGFEGTEIGGCYPNCPDELNKELALRNMKIAAQWFSGYILRDGVEKVKEDFIKHCDFLNKVGADVAVYSEQSASIQGLTDVCVYTEKPIYNDEEFKQLAEGLNELGEIANSFNLKLCYHHHMGTGIQTLEETRKLMNLTDSSKVYLLYDTGHIFVSDREYMPLLKEFKDRIGHVHFKDVRIEKLDEAVSKDMSFLNSFLHGIFTVPGDGCIDYKEVYDFLLSIEYKGWIVVEAEQDPKIANPLEYAIKGYNYMQTLRKYI
ncbi:myo-inosose-2 dehydratase [Gemella sp. GH3]|uniref:myo-inosose-2 dehydratase n=1 Tax=unclassified Gemella TaxID=2624949 RepID=UPI0015CFAD6D|nr:MULTISPECIES: myo-inosose-2 dehydratase [unclassified Gemella]MBF0714068.1 myo-inosose-2 dehydratase [Gemella sp. GH3.1]NYS51020.1 myo-inosose-2 dehydratase [Gemella sp. GH3]